MSKYLDEIKHQMLEERESRKDILEQLLGQARSAEEQLAEIDEALRELRVEAELKRPEAVFGPAPEPEPEPEPEPRRRRGRRGLPAPNRHQYAGRTILQWLMLLRNEFGENPFTQSEAARAVGTDKPTASRAIRTLIANGDAWVDGRRPAPIAANGVPVGRPSTLYRVQPWPTLEAAQRAWDNQNGTAAVPAGIKVNRGMPIPGTGQSREVNAMSPDLYAVVKNALIAGWVPEFTGKGHIKFTHPDKPGIFMTTANGSDRHALKNLKAEMRKAGAPL